MAKSTYLYLFFITLSLYGIFRIAKTIRNTIVSTERFIVEIDEVRNNAITKKTPAKLNKNKETISQVSTNTPVVVKKPTKTDVEKVLYPEEVFEKKPSMDNEEKIYICFEKLREDVRNKEKVTTQARKCITMQVMADNCPYAEDKEACQEENQAEIKTLLYNFMNGELNENN